jgi:hypothetical protein
VATLAAQSTARKIEIRPFVGASLPAGEQRDIYADAPLLGVQVALEAKPTFHLVGTFGWTASQTELDIGNDEVSVLTYELGFEFNTVKPLGGDWELKPFLTFGAGARTYVYGGDVHDGTCSTGYLGGGTEFQIVPWALRLEARYNAFCYQAPYAAESETRYDLGLMFGLAYHFR